MSALPKLRKLADADSLSLIVVDTRTGESLSFEEGTQALRDEIDGLRRDVRAWQLRCAAMKRDADAEAAADPLWPQAIELFALWKKLCKHPRSAFTTDRFDAIRPFLKPYPAVLRTAAEALGMEVEENPYGPAICRLAIVGASFDPYTTKRKNGTTKRHDDWDLVFRSAGKVEEFACRAPRDPR